MRWILLLVVLMGCGADEGPAPGKPCGAHAGSVCADGVSLICSDGKWEAVHDGPCEHQG